MPTPTEPQADVPAAHRRLEEHEQARWQDFYADRSRKRPFFVDEPDENLVDWCRRGWLAPGAALDVGCGNGRNAVFLAEQGFVVQGVDLSAQALAWAAETAQRRGVQLQLRQASIFEQPPAAASLDLVYDSGCFHHVAPHRRQDYVALLARALRPGGRLGLVCFRPEGGSGLDDEQVYHRGSLGGGLGYDEATLRISWGEAFEILELRRMHEPEPGSGCFGLGCLWVMLAQRAEAGERP